MNKTDEILKELYDIEEPDGKVRIRMVAATLRKHLSETESVKEALGEHLSENKKLLKKLVLAVRALGFGPDGYCFCNKTKQLSKNPIEPEPRPDLVSRIEELERALNQHASVLHSIGNHVSLHGYIAEVEEVE